MENGSVKPREIDGFSGNVGDVSPKSGDLVATFEFEGFGTVKAVLFPEAAPLGAENFRKLADSGYYTGKTVHRVIKDFMLQGGSENGDGTGGDALVNGGSFGIETAQNARHFYGALSYANASGRNSTQFYIVNCKEPQELDALNRKALLDTMEMYATYAEDAANGMIPKYSDPRYIEHFRFQAQYYREILAFADGASDAIKDAYLKRGGTPMLDGNYTVFGQVYEGFDVIDSISAVKVGRSLSDEASKPIEDIIIKNITVSTV